MRTEDKFWIIMLSILSGMLATSFILLVVEFAKVIIVEYLTNPSTAGPAIAFWLIYIVGTTFFGFVIYKLYVSQMINE